ncbi:MAG: sugar MFS transporter [Cytophagales bacterium]|nr:sugar MFS transporter [Cytophagales bacterium]
MKINDPKLSPANYLPQFVIVTLMFFIFGFLTTMNGVLVPKFKENFSLDYFQATLVQFAFFTAYLVVSLIYFLVSFYFRKATRSFHYKGAMVYGLFVTALGAFGFYPSTQLESYPLFLFSLFVMASGITLIQTGVNPYVALLGKPRTASGRLNLTQAFNSLGTTLAPLIGSLWLAADSGSKETFVLLDHVYLLMAVIVVLVAVSTWRMRFPDVARSKGYEEVDVSRPVFKTPHLMWGALAIFFYVGAEVSVGSLLISLIELKAVAGFSAKKGAQFLSLYWAGLMVGRFFAAIYLSKVSRKKRPIFVFLVLMLAFGVALGVSDFGWLNAVIYLVLVLFCYTAFLFNNQKPRRLLVQLAVYAVVCIFAVVFLRGTISMWLAIALGLCHSVMFPTIFTLAIRELGENTPQGTSILMMAIVGGAILPVVQGHLSDIVGVKSSFLMLLVSYAYILFYALKGADTPADTFGKE